MKLALQKSPIDAQQVIEIPYHRETHFDPNSHFHSEYQLFVVLKGTGTRFVGDHVKPFKEGDIVFTGPDLPHLWRSDPEYFEGNRSLWAEGIVIYFHDNFLGDTMLEKKELFKIRQLLANARQGMEIIGRTAVEVRQAMSTLLDQKDFDRVLGLLSILNKMANTNDQRLLSSEGYTNTLKELDTERMNQVHAYVLRHFREKIGLKDVASIASMTPTSFSRYFKTHANKTFSEFLTAIRVGFACRLLIEKKMNISQACYESGFYTMSNFNRHFKSVTGHSPIAYKKIYNEAQVL
jgi:AraC-like DNA-binding protein